MSAALKIVEGQKFTNRTPEVIAAEWLAAKKAENDANKARVALEVEYLALKPAKTEGSSTDKLDGFKVTKTGVISRKIDMDTYLEMEASIPEDLRFVQTVRKLDETGVKYLQANEPDFFAEVVAKVVTESPGKTGFKVERVD